MSPDCLAPDCEQELQECFNAMQDIVARMERFPRPVVALALRLHLEELLQILMERRLANREEVRAFLQELEQNTLPDFWP